MMTSNISIIVAVDKNNGIGRNGDQLAYISGDLKRFKALTTGHTIVMGRKTFEALPKGALPNRRNVVITRKKDFHPEGCDVYHSVEDVLKTLGNDDEVFIIGGGEIYKAFLPYTQKIYLTVIEHEFEGVDTFFPEINDSEWETAEHDGTFVDEKSGLNYRYITLKKK
ncbi:MAG: dihydrofolate reductase [Chlorobi bacterium]|nr:dihydrofolate reductase [Chlorobiota bacterium]